MTREPEIEDHAKPVPTSLELETIPAFQYALAIVVNLPEGCRASSEAIVDGKERHLGRLVLDDATLEGIYSGKIRNWKQLIKAQDGDGDDSLECMGGEDEELKTIHPVVPLNHLGITHTFKSFLAQVSGESMVMEKYPIRIRVEGGSDSTGCGKEFPEETGTWNQVNASELAQGFSGEGPEPCQNQRWPTAADVERPGWSGDEPYLPYGEWGVLNQVGTEESSIGFANLATARDSEYFSARLRGGGEYKKGEQNPRFWAPIQDGGVNGTGKVTYGEPSTKGDTEKDGYANCEHTEYWDNYFYPAEDAEGYRNNGDREHVWESAEDSPLWGDQGTLQLWNEVTARLEQKEWADLYPLCGMTYDLAFRQYQPYFEAYEEKEVHSYGEDAKRPTTVENYLMYLVSKRSKNRRPLEEADYYPLEKWASDSAEAGVEEIEW